jgi:hypothetical protein
LRETEYFLKIEIENLSPDPNKKQNGFNWLRGGNITLGLEVAKRYCNQNVPLDREGSFAAQIQIKDRQDNTVFFWNHRRGNIRLSIAVAEEFARQKLGFDLVSLIRGVKKDRKESLY